MGMAWHGMPSFICKVPEYFWNLKQEDIDPRSASQVSIQPPSASSLAPDVVADALPCAVTDKDSMMRRFAGLPSSPSAPHPLVDAALTMDEGGRGQLGYAALMSQGKPSEEGVVAPSAAGNPSPPPPQGMLSIRVVRPASHRAPDPTLQSESCKAPHSERGILGGKDSLSEKLSHASDSENTLVPLPATTHSGMTSEAIMSALTSLMPSEEQQMELQEVLQQLSYNGNQELGFEKVIVPDRREIEMTRL